MSTTLWIPKTEVREATVTLKLQACNSAYLDSRILCIAITNNFFAFAEYPCKRHANRPFFVFYYTISFSINKRRQRFTSLNTTSQWGGHAWNCRRGIPISSLLNVITIFLTITYLGQALWAALPAPSGVVLSSVQTDGRQGLSFDITVTPDASPYDWNHTYCMNSH